MLKQPPSIFNDVIGPVMTGPSSSHTAGPTRIGKLAMQLVQGRLKKVTAEFESNGSFAMTYKGQKSDKGLVGGLLGWDPGDPRIPYSLEEAQRQGIDVVFEIKKFKADHPNTVRITLIDEFDEKVELTALSVGGGMVEIVEIDGFACSVAGDFYELFVFFKDPEKELMDDVKKTLESMGVDIQYSHFSKVDNRGLINIKTEKPVPDTTVMELKKLNRVTQVKQVAPVLPVISRRSSEVPFRTASKMLEIARENHMQLWEIATLYEAERSGWSKEEVFSKMKQIATIMTSSVQTGLDGKMKMEGILRPQSMLIRKAEEKGTLIPVGAINTVISWAMAVLEVNSSMGIVVAAPTAGSCGVLPGAVLGTAEAMGLGDDEKAKALLAAGGIGVLIAEQATFAAEVCGCQAECGAASAMAAAGVVQLAGGTADQGVAAASIALQNLLGLICDPVAELVEVPCLGKNVMAAVNAVASANMALAGVYPVIPLDEVIQAMYQVGKMLPRELRCTGLGGLAVTPTSQEIKRRLSSAKQ